MDFSRTQESWVCRVFSTCIDLIAPTYCCNCGTFGLLLCSKCFSLIKYTQFAIAPHAGYASLASTESHQTSILQSVHTTAMYSGPIAELIKTMKFAGVIGVCEYLAKLTYYSCTLPAIDILCPVPLHKNRKRQRGFDQALEITKHLADLYQIPWVPLLHRKQHLAAQSGVSSKTERLGRLQNAYCLSSQGEKMFQIMLQNNQTKQLKIGLVDDVFTTGATLQACSKVLEMAWKEKSCSQQILIVGICMARD